MKSVLFLLVLASFESVAAAQPVASEPTHAPQPRTEGAPSESLLGPPPDAEKTPLPAGYVEVFNPAFPLPWVEPAKVRVDKGRAYRLEDLSPYFAEGRKKEAKEAFDRGLYVRARALLHLEGDALPVRYLRALSAVRAGDDARAAEEMTALAEDYPALSDRCLTHAGMALEQLGRFEESAARLGRVPEDSKLYVDARLGMARVLRKKKDYDGAMAALAPLTARPAPSFGRSVGAEALMATADIAAEKKDREHEREALWKLWARYPLSQLTKQAERRLKGLKPPLEAQVARAEQLIELHRNKQGLTALEPLLPSLKLPEPLACRAHFAFGKGMRKERQHTRAIATLVPVVEKCQDADLLPRAMYVLGSSRSIVEPRRGTETYERLAREFPGHSFADDALFYAADLYVKTNQLDQALTRLEELERNYPKGDFLGEALFKAFWIARTRKVPDGGLDLLSRIEQRFADADETYDVERAQYWRARTLQDRGDMPGAVTLFEKLAVEHPATYYGLMARSQLGEVDKDRLERIAPQLVFAPETASPWPLHAGTMQKDPHFLASVEMMRLGFPEAVTSELLAVNRTGLPPESVRLIVHLLSLAGDERSAHAVARVALRRDLGGRITPQTRSVWEIAYPNAFRELIEKHTRAAGVEPDLLQALMREESALDPKALSWAGALGLTQLMPYTAKGVAQQLKIKNFRVEALLEPDLNIRLGAHYLGELIKKFDGHTPFAVGSYNAGSGAVNRWRSERPGMPLDAWVEEVPIAETRGYIKRVLRSFNTYQLLYGRPAKVPVVKSAGL
ncbi:transglycosylase SLT domain-containing protein [Stigmatella sp. ncwal1]|uniref:Transglycosylase SLT domain-containing protein n=1 Tax=Stigmatella ashevillensis TaxID=2995309 RepID=A0ABT5D0Q1_9BACT|nr:transglycosylase SLT domain-containing protein [Stigmatella ashevillena]MDC0707246.1 transglycosylase SLT domain-containing protein [Stigmatella ashevillena]